MTFQTDSWARLIPNTMFDHGRTWSYVLNDVSACVVVVRVQALISCPFDLCDKAVWMVSSLIVISSLSSSCCRWFRSVLRDLQAPELLLPEYSSSVTSNYAQYVFIGMSVNIGF